MPSCAMLCAVVMDWTTPSLPNPRMTCARTTGSWTLREPQMRCWQGHRVRQDHDGTTSLWQRRPRHLPAVEYHFSYNSSRRIATAGTPGCRESAVFALMSCWQLLARVQVPVAVVWLSGRMRCCLSQTTAASCRWAHSGAGRGAALGPSARSAITKRSSLSLWQFYSNSIR